MKIVKIVIISIVLLSMGKFVSPKNFPHTLSHTQPIGTVVTSITNKLLKIYAGAEELMATPEHLLQSDVGTSEITNFSFAHDGKITFNQHLLKKLTYSVSDNSSCYDCGDGYSLTGVYENIGFESNNPFELIDFTNSSSILFGFESLDNFNFESSRGGFTVPAIALQYCKTRIANSDRIRNYRVALDVLCIASIPFTGGWSAAGLGTRLAIISVYSMGIAGGLDLISMANGDEIQWLKSLRDLANGISLVTMGGSILGGGVNLLQNGLVKLSQQLTSPQFAGLATKIKKLHALIGENKVAINNLLNAGKATQKEFLAQLLNMDIECQKILTKLSMNAVELMEYTNFSAKLADCNLLKVNTANGQKTYEMINYGNGQVTTTVATEGGGKVKVQVSVDAIPNDAVRVEIVRHGTNDVSHINKAGAETKESLLLGKRANGSRFICEGKLVNGKHVGNCFVKGTKVLTPNGTVPIESIAVGNLVNSYSEKDNKSIIDTVTNLSNRVVGKLVKLITAAKDTIFCTPEHPFFTSSKQWIQASKLNTNSKLLTISGLLVSIQSLSVIDTAATVYNFEVATTHTYAVGNSNAIVHNECGVIYQEAFNKLSLETNFATELKPIIHDIDQALITYTDANAFLGEGFSIMKKEMLKDVILMPEFSTYAKGEANKTFTWLNDYTFIKAAPVADRAGLAKFFIEARMSKLSTGAKAEYDVSTYSRALLKDMYDLAKTCKPLPATHNASTLAPFLVTKSANGTLVELNNFAVRTNLAKLNAQELEMVVKNMSMADVIKYYDAKSLFGKLVKTNANKIEYTNPNGSLMSWKEQSQSSIKESIQTAHDLVPTSPNYSIGRLNEGKAGKLIEGKKNVEAFGQDISPNIGEIDISTIDEIIEVKTSFSSVSENQFDKFLDKTLNNFCNPYQKKVILYIDKPLSSATTGQLNMIVRIEAKGVKVVYSLEELGGAIK